MTTHEPPATLRRLSTQVQSYRARCFAARNLTPLAVDRRAAVGWGWVVQHNGQWIVTRSSRPTPDTIRCEVLIGIRDGSPVWAVFDEGPAQQMTS